MSQDYGRRVSDKHVQQQHRPAARYLVVLLSGGAAVARMFLATREQVAEFDASTEEVVTMTRGLTPSRGALAPEWDQALAGHSREEREQAEVYALDV